MSRVSNSLCNFFSEYFASFLKIMSQYLLLLISRMLVQYKAFGDWEVQYMTCERKTLYMWMMPEKIPMWWITWDLWRQAELTELTKWTSLVAEQNQCQERAVLKGIISSLVSDCGWISFLLCHQLWRDQPSDKQFTLQISQKLGRCQCWPVQIYAPVTSRLF